MKRQKFKKNKNKKIFLTQAQESSISYDYFCSQNYIQSLYTNTKRKQKNIKEIKKHKKIKKVKSFQTQNQNSQSQQSSSDQEPNQNSFDDYQYYNPKKISWNGLEPTKKQQPVQVMDQQAEDTLRFIKQMRQSINRQNPSHLANKNGQNILQQ